jgi:hypothetical protein
MNTQTSNRAADWLEDLEAVAEAYGPESKEVEFQIGRTVTWLKDYKNLTQVMQAALRHAPSVRSAKIAEDGEEKMRKYIASLPAHILELQSGK